MVKEKIWVTLATLALVGTAVNCGTASSDETETASDASENGDRVETTSDGSTSRDARESDPPGSSGFGPDASNDSASDAASAGQTDGSRDNGATESDAVVSCQGPQCCWTDCVSGKQTCGEFEPLEECSIVQVPAWFEQRTCVVDYASLVPFADVRQGIGYCACVQADQVATAEIPVEETADGCIYTYGGDPCGGVDLSSCFPETDAGSGTGGTGGSTSASECTSDSSCSSRQVCRDGRCVSVQCTSDSHCGSCSRCSSNVCRSCGYGPYGCYC